MSSIDPNTMKHEVLFDAEQIARRVQELGAQITKDLNGEPAIVVCVLKGAFVFTADLVRAIKSPIAIEFIGVASYLGTSSTGTVRITHDLTADIRGKNVILVEDIADTGRTLDYLIRFFRQRSPKSIRICAMLNKPSAREVTVTPDYSGFEIGNEFVIGYGLDYEQRFRELPYIARVLL